MDDRAGIGIVDQRDVLVDRVVGLHLEAVPVRPHRRADAVAGQQIGDLVALDRMVEGRDPESELARHVHHQRHLVGAVAMVVDEDVSGEDVGQCVERHVARDVGVAGPAVAIFGRALPGLPHQGDIAHPGLRHLVAAAIDPLGILAACHLEPARRTREAHLLHGPGRHVAQGDAAASEQIGRSGKDLEGRDAAVDQRSGETGILRPDAMFGPNFGADRARHLVAVGMGLDAGARIIAEMGVNVDHAGRHPSPGTVDPGGIFGDRRIGAAHRLDPSVGENDRAIVDPAAFAVENGRAGDGGRDSGIGPVGGREGIFRRRVTRRRRLGLAGGGLRLRFLARAAYRQHRGQSRGDHP